jgi:hypothetical protein
VEGGVSAEGRRGLFREQWAAEHHGASRPGRLIRHPSWTRWTTFVLFAAVLAGLVVLTLVRVPDAHGHQVRLVTVLVP